MNLIETYLANKPASYGPIVSLNFTQHEDLTKDDDIVVRELRLILAKGIELSGERLGLRFLGIYNLRFEQPELSLASLGFIELFETDFGFRAHEEQGLLKFDFQDLKIKRFGINENLTWPD
ncbi:MAG: hypothetical protein AAF604_09640 [Acidobacteriota bacterium]